MAAKEPRIRPWGGEISPEFEPKPGEVVATIRSRTLSPASEWAYKGGWNQDRGCGCSEEKGVPVGLRVMPREVTRCGTACQAGEARAFAAAASGSKCPAGYHKEYSEGRNPITEYVYPLLYLPVAISPPFNRSSRFFASGAPSPMAVRPL